MEAQNLRVFVGTVKGDAELKQIYSMLKYNDLFVTQNISGNVIAFGWSSNVSKTMDIQYSTGQAMGMPEVKFLGNPIEMHTHFS